MFHVKQFATFSTPGFNEPILLYACGENLPTCRSQVSTHPCLMLQIQLRAQVIDQVYEIASPGIIQHGPLADNHSPGNYLEFTART
jgi:hypothetical protein